MTAVWLLLLALAAPVDGGAYGQQVEHTTVRGRVLDRTGAPLPDQRVVLHRVRNGAGSTVAESATSDAGEFELEVPLEADTTALYFVATQFEGELYIGAPFRPATGSAPPQDIQVGVPGTSATAVLGGAAQPRTTGRPLTSRNWMLLAIPLLGVALVALYMLVPKGRVPPERVLLIRLAELDERMTNAPAAQRESLREERGRLMTQLRAG